ncbi:hypothetical protein PoB_001602900 [Plakobranchus ocellatus]|uniref:Uncharacterized protein n=1 Tax=Plakobranchus ocellatus TaxID=259542 RepID=A0AAV3Z572_9GAST|nr:hypothetical protein PoB_001602900 [Plakobranchus ocellatus]
MAQRPVGAGLPLPPPTMELNGKHKEQMKDKLRSNTLGSRLLVLEQRASGALCVSSVYTSSLDFEGGTKRRDGCATGTVGRL